MSPLALALLGVGILLVAIGVRRAREPWARYQALREQDANVARYESWRGGTRGSDTTGASVAMEILRRRAREGALVAAVGFAFVLAAFLLT